MPQPNKGDRAYVPARVPTPYARKLERLAHATGRFKGDILSDALVEYLDHIDIDEVEGQETLPISA